MNTIVLDLDSTLIFARPLNILAKPIEDERNFCLRPVALQEIFQVTIRKHVAHFIAELKKRGFRVVVWSAGTETYVKDIVSVLFKNIEIDYLLTRNHTVDDIKILTELKRFIPEVDMERVLLIDDNCKHAEGQEKLCMIIEPFVFDGSLPTDEEDDELLLTLADEIAKKLAP